MSVDGSHRTVRQEASAVDTLAGALLDGGLDERETAWTTWTIIYFPLGLTQEEQAAAHQSPDGRLTNAVSETAYPALHRVLGHLGAESIGERFE